MNPATSSEGRSPELQALEAAVSRAIAPAPDAPGRARAAVDAVERGEPLDKAFADVKAPVGMAKAVAASGATHPALAVDALTAALAKRRSRLLQLRSAGLYPALVSLSTLVVGWLISVDVVPQLDGVRAVVRGVDEVTSTAGATLPSVVVSSVLLCLLALGLAFDVPVLGFRDARRARETALFFAAVEGLLRAGAGLVGAVRAASGLVGDPIVSTNGERWAAALERGEPNPTGLLNGLPGALVSESIRSGTVAAALVPIVALAEREASREASSALQRVQFATLLLAGLGLLLTAVSFVRAYAGAVGSG